MEWLNVHAMLNMSQKCLEIILINVFLIFIYSKKKITNLFCMHYINLQRIRKLDKLHYMKLIKTYSIFIVFFKHICDSGPQNQS